MHPGKPRKWTISGWYPSDPGSGGVYVEGPALEPGESVTVTEQTDDDENPITGTLRRVDRTMSYASWKPAAEVPDNEDPDLPICGRLLVGRGPTDTHDPLCVLPPGHKGRCLGSPGEDVENPRPTTPWFEQ